MPTRKKNLALLRRLGVNVVNVVTLDDQRPRAAVALTPWGTHGTIPEVAEFVRAVGEEYAAALAAAYKLGGEEAVRETVAALQAASRVGGLAATDAVARAVVRRA